jgi:hypothetical protein
LALGGDNFVTFSSNKELLRRYLEMQNDVASIALWNFNTGNRESVKINLVARAQCIRLVTVPPHTQSVQSQKSKSCCAYLNTVTELSFSVWLCVRSGSGKVDEDDSTTQPKPGAGHSRDAPRDVYMSYMRPNQEHNIVSLVGTLKFDKVEWES